MLIIQHIQVPDDIFILHLSPAKRHSLVENRKRVTHGAVSLSRDNVKRLVIDRNSLFLSNIPEILHDIRNTDTVKIVCLATRQNSRKNLMFLCSRQYENGMSRRLLKRLQKRIESRLGKHVYLIDDIHTILADLWRNLHLIHESLYVIHAVIGRGIQLMNTIRPSLLERNT